MSELTTQAKARRRQRAASASHVQVYWIGGGPVTLAAIAERLACHPSTASARLKREQGKSGPVTWEGLAS